MRRKFATFAWFVLAVQVLVILWGAYVRASKSGAGCGEHWPLCNGEVLPTAPPLPMIIEFTHRITSGIALLLVVALVVWAFRAFPVGDLVRSTAGWSGVFIVTESLIGAALVLLGHTALNPSASRGITLTIHLINTMFLLGALTLTAWWAGAESVGEGKRAMRGVFYGAVAVFLAAGVVGAIAALGDTLFAPGSVAAGFTADFAAEAHPFVRIRILHPIIAVIAGLSLSAIAVQVIGSSTATPVAKRLGALLIGLVVIQFLAGGLNIYLLVPIPMQMVHLFLADALWIALILLGAETLHPSLRQAV
jgi:heme A synthase